MELWALRGSPLVAIARESPRLLHLKHHLHVTFPTGNQFLHLYPRRALARVSSILAVHNFDPTPFSLDPAESQKWTREFSFARWKVSGASYSDKDALR